MIDPAPMGDEEKSKRPPAQCRQCGDHFFPEEDSPEDCRFHPGDFHEGSGVENYEMDWWDCNRFGGEDARCVQSSSPGCVTGRHIAKGARDNFLATGSRGAIRRVAGN